MYNGKEYGLDSVINGIYLGHGNALSLIVVCLFICLLVSIQGPFFVVQASPIIHILWQTKTGQFSLKYFK